MAVVDSENRLLFGIYRATGKPYFPLNEMYHVEQNEEFFAVWLDAANLYSLVSEETEKSLVKSMLSMP